MKESRCSRRSIATASILAALLVAAVPANGELKAAQINMVASDQLGSSSFNTGLNWSNGQAPSAGNTYAAPGFTLRTPPNGGNFTFAGDSLTLSGGTLAFKGFNGDTITVNNLTLDNGYIGAFAGGGPTFNMAGNITVTANGGGFDTGASGRGTNVTAPISGMGGLVIYDGGTVYYSNANTYSGNTVINASVLQLNNANALQNSTVSQNSDNDLRFGSGIGTFNLGGLSGTNQITLVDTANQPVNLNVSGNGQSTEFSGSLAGGGNLTKNGAGTLTLSGSNSYSGTTNVSSGTLALVTSGTNNINASNAINVGTGATLDVTGVSGSGSFTLNGQNGQILSGSGTVLGSVNAVSGSHISVSGNPGPLTLGGLTLAAGSTLDYQFNGTPANGFLAVSTAGGLTLNGGGVNLLQAGTTNPFDTPGTYHLIHYAGALQGAGLSSLNVTDPQPGMLYLFSNNTALDDIDLKIAARIPGDVNGDGIVNGLDIQLISSYWLRTGATPGDANGDGVVNGLDISVVASHWLQSDGSGSVSTAAVPEPPTVFLLGPAVAGAIAMWRRSRRLRSAQR